jgi:hypothetical protein
MMNATIKSPFDPFALVFNRSLTDKSCKWILFTFVSLLIFMTIFPGSIYIRQYPQDIFGFLDGIHRTVSGQIAHRDFSSVLGIMVYALPALFVRFGVDPVLSLAYAQAVLLILNFVVLFHLLNTRISGLPGLLFGLWTALALAARMNLGEYPQYVTFAMNYDRYCTVFLSEIVLMSFIRPRNANGQKIIIEAVLISLLTLIIFYSKITFFMVAVAALLLLSLTSRTNATRMIVAMLLFLIVAVSLEVRYRFHRAYFADLVIAVQSSDSRLFDYKGVLWLTLRNLPELVLCVIVPFIILSRNWVLSSLDGLTFLFVAGASVLLLSQNAQQEVLALPFLLLLIALDIIDRRTERGTRLVVSKGLIYAITIWMWFLYSYPLVVNCTFSFAKSIWGGKPIGTENTLKRFVIDWRNSDPQLTHDIIRGGGSSFDLFDRTRVSATGIPGMFLSEAEYAISLEDGFKAARAGCGESARILTADLMNPFPAVLDLPVGGGMIYLQPNRTFSIKSHLPPDKMFNSITCVMVPKMPIAYPARQLFLSVYDEYLKRSFEMRAETDYWIVYKLNRRSASKIPGITTSQ